MNKTILSFSLASTVAAASAVNGAVLNPSFESQTVASGGFTASNPSTITNWSGAGTGVGNVGLLGSSFGPSDGVNLAYLNLNNNGTGFLEQVLTDTVTADTAYSLSVDYKATGGNIPASWTLKLMAGATVLASATSTSGGTSYNTLTIVPYVVLPTDANIGTALTVRLESTKTGGSFAQPEFDNIVFSSVAVPEPASLGLLASAGVMALRRRRHA